MSDEYTPSTDEVRQMANSYDGVPNDVFDRWLAAHDAEIHAAGVAAGIRQAQEADESLLRELYELHRNSGANHDVTFDEMTELFALRFG